jgi:hypothetical protein
MSFIAVILNKLVYFYSKGFVAQIVTSGINPLLRISTIEIMVCAISSEPSLLDCSLRSSRFSRGL